MHSTHNACRANPPRPDSVTAGLAQIIQESIQEQFTSADPSNVVLTPVDFPVDAAFTLAGVSLAQWNSIPHIQDTFQAGLAGDLGLDSANQVTIGDFNQQGSGLYVPFTVTGLGGTNAQALQVRGVRTPRTR